MLPPGGQQQSGATAALAALGSVGGLAGGLSAKTPDELYVALLRSDSVLRALDTRFELRARYEVDTHEVLRKTLPRYVRIGADKKTGVISVEADDEDPKFAAELANAHLQEVTLVLSRLAVSEAQQRRQFFEGQLASTKESLVSAEAALRSVQESSGVVALDRQAEALIAGVARLRATIVEREVRLRVLRTNATDQNPDVQRLMAEIQALRAELARAESAQGQPNESGMNMSVSRLPATATRYIRALREVKLQESLLEAMLRQFELAKLDEAKEGPLLQTIDIAVPPDYKSKPSRAVIVLGTTLVGFLLASGWVIVTRHLRESRARHPERARAFAALARAWLGHRQGY